MCGKELLALIATSRVVSGRLQSYGRLREGGLEPPRLSAQAPKTCVSASSTTLASAPSKYFRRTPEASREECKEEEQCGTNLCFVIHGLVVPYGTSAGSSASASRSQTWRSSKYRSSSRFCSGAIS